MGRRKLTIESVRATNKDNNVMRIIFNYGKDKLIIDRDCTHKGIYSHIDEYIKSNKLDCVKDFAPYEEAQKTPQDKDAYSIALGKLTNYNSNGYENTRLHNYMMVITE